MKRFLLLLLLGTLGLQFGTAHAVEPLLRKDHVVLYKVKDTFASVRENLELAITDRGLVVNNVSHISKMLARTGKDLGADKQVYVDAESLEFCSATASRNMMEADPTNIVFCPYIISVYTLPNEAGTVYVAYRRPQAVGSKASQDSLRAVETLLDTIASEALDW